MSSESLVLREIIDKTIAHFINIDPNYFIAPYLYAGEIDNDCPFFRDNRISVVKNLDSESLKTISYLAPFYRKRASYSPDNINFYLRAIGRVSYDEIPTDIACYTQTECGYEGDFILFRDWKKLT